MKVMMYTSENCAYCEGAKLLCSTKGYEYNQVVVGRDIQREEFVEMYPAQRTVPLIFVTEDGLTSKIGGYQEFKKWAEAREATRGMTL